VNEFVEECRREWRRLRVPDPVANEMAADLAVDLEEAEAEGVPAEEVLGRGAADPRSFAASWATERGVIQPRPLRDRLPKGSLMVAAVAAFAVIAVVGAALATFASSPGSAPLLAGRPVEAPVTTARLVISAPLVAHEDISGTDARAIGRTLWIVGLAGIVLVALLWWAGSGRRLRRRA
jgi:hypothetical protein